MRRLSDDLKAEGWGVLAISLQKLLIARVRATGEANLASLAARFAESLLRGEPHRGKIVATVAADKIREMI